MGSRRVVEDGDDDRVLMADWGRAGRVSRAVGMWEGDKVDRRGGSAPEAERAWCGRESVSYELYESPKQGWKSTRAAGALERQGQQRSRTCGSQEKCLKTTRYIVSACDDLPR